MLNGFEDQIRLGLALLACRLGELVLKLFGHVNRHPRHDAILPRSAWPAVYDAARMPRRRPVYFRAAPIPRYDRTPDLGMLIPRQLPCERCDGRCSPTGAYAAGKFEMVWDQRSITPSSGNETLGGVGYLRDGRRVTAFEPHRLARSSRPLGAGR